MCVQETAQPDGNSAAQQRPTRAGKSFPYARNDVLSISNQKERPHARSLRRRPSPVQRAPCCVVEVASGGEDTIVLPIVVQAIRIFGSHLQLKDRLLLRHENVPCSISTKSILLRAVGRLKLRINALPPNPSRTNECRIEVVLMPVIAPRRVPEIGLNLLPLLLALDRKLHP